MSIKSNIPQIAMLRKRVEERFGRRLTIHADFVVLVAAIEEQLREHISETTLERVWGYSTRGYATVSLRTLNVLTQYAVGCDWHNFCQCLAHNKECESEIFDTEIILSSELKVGERLRIGWLPDRLCELRYMGDNRFVAEVCHNSKLQAGDTFVCAQFTLGKELTMSNLVSASNPASTPHYYTVGTRHGLTTLSLIDEQ